MDVEVNKNKGCWSFPSEEKFHCLLFAVLNFSSSHNKSVKFFKHRQVENVARFTSQ